MAKRVARQSPPDGVREKKKAKQREEKRKESFQERAAWDLQKRNR